MLTGRLPFRGNPQMLLHQVINEEPPNPRMLNANVNRDLETIALKCMEKEPAKRYQTARELADDLRRFLAGKPIHARPIGRFERGLRWARRKPETAALAALVVALLIGTITVLAVSNEKGRLESTDKESPLIVPGIAQEETDDAVLTDGDYTIESVDNAGYYCGHAGPAHQWRTDRSVIIHADPVKWKVRRVGEDSYTFENVDNKEYFLNHAGPVRAGKSSQNVIIDHEPVKWGGDAP